MDHRPGSLSPGRTSRKPQRVLYSRRMSEIKDPFEPLRVVIDAEEVKGLAHAENELTRYLSDFPDAPQKIAALVALEERAKGWPKNDISRFLLLRIKDKRRYFISAGLS